MMTSRQSGFPIGGEGNSQTTHGYIVVEYEMMHEDWSNIEEVPNFFSMSVKFKGHTGQKITDFDPNWSIPDSNSRLNSLMALKWSTKLNVA